jgi:hypothetical protein
MIQHEPDFSLKLNQSFLELKERYNLLLAEFIVWHALVGLAVSQYGSQQVRAAVTTATIIENTRLSRETVRRCLLGLQKKKLATKIGSGWIPASGPADAAPKAIRLEQEQRVP